MFVLNENDFDSPGYEYLRSYQSMNNLYQKLVALGHQKEFCSRYKCPPIHKYYFATPDKNHQEQQFIFTCLCAWLIKDKCQMNLELDPEEYEDLDTTIGVILEAVRLLLVPDEESATSAVRSSRKDATTKNVIKFPPGRLKQAYGPEVIWTLNILADRAMELFLADSPGVWTKSKIIYHNNNSTTDRPQSVANSITIGQPHVGGGLTTRPLGNYQIDDATLLFDDGDPNSVQINDIDRANDGDNDDEMEPGEWYDRVERVRPILEAASARLALDDGGGGLCESWSAHATALLKSKQAIQDFLNDSSSLLEVVSTRVDRQLQVISMREKFIQTNLSNKIESFLQVYREYSLEMSNQRSLIGQVNLRTDKFEGYCERLAALNGQIELRKRELSDGGKLRELESMINRLRDENLEFDVKIGLLLTAYARCHARIVSSQASAKDEDDNNNNSNTRGRSREGS